MATFVSLFKAINVGGNRLVKMTVLKEMHESLGLKSVSHYLQTGNVVFESDNAEPTQLAATIATQFEKTFGFRSEVMVRTPAELKEIFDNNPFYNQPEKETKWVAVIFLTGYPDLQTQQALHNNYKGPEELFLIGQELYVYYPDGVGRSKLTTSVIEKNLKVAGTGRNWNTVMKLLEMVQR